MQTLQTNDVPACLCFLINECTECIKHIVVPRDFVYGTYVWSTQFVFSVFSFDRTAMTFLGNRWDRHVLTVLTAGRVISPLPTFALKGATLVKLFTERSSWVSEFSDSDQRPLEEREKCRCHEITHRSVINNFASCVHRFHLCGINANNKNDVFSVIWSENLILFMGDPFWVANHCKSYGSLIDTWIRHFPSGTSKFTEVALVLGIRMEILNSCIHIVDSGISMLMKSYVNTISVIICDRRDFELFNELNMNNSVTVRGIQKP